MRMKIDLPHVTEILIQSDNAKCYKPNELLVGLSKTVSSHGLKLLVMVHSGVQDGKGPIDGHFGTSMKHVTQYCNSGHDVATGRDIVHALQAIGGVCNSVELLVGINRSAVEEAIVQVCKTGNHYHKLDLKMIPL